MLAVFVALPHSLLASPKTPLREAFRIHDTTGSHCHLQLHSDLELQVWMKALKYETENKEVYTMYI